MSIKQTTCRLAVWCCGMVAGISAAPSLAQDWKPGKPVELVVGSAPGGSPDVMARLVQAIFQTSGLVPNTAG